MKAELYKNVELNQQFKFKEDDFYYYKKVKIKRRIVYIRMDNSFTFCTPINQCKNDLIVFID